MYELPHREYRAAAHRVAFARTVHMSRRQSLWVGVVGVAVLGYVVALFLALITGQSLGPSALLGVAGTVIAALVLFLAVYLWQFGVVIPAETKRQLDSREDELRRHKERMRLFFRLYEVRAKARDTHNTTFVPHSDDPRPNFPDMARIHARHLEEAAQILRDHGEENVAEQCDELRQEVFADADRADQLTIVAGTALSQRVLGRFEELMSPGGPLFSPKLGEIMFGVEVYPGREMLL